MPLDPQLAEIVRLANANGGGAMDTSDVARLREVSRTSALAYGPGPKVRSVVDRAIPGPRGPVPIRIYAPEGDPVGVVVFFHGSGFVIFDLDAYDRECGLLANGAGALVVSVDYALAPEQPFPAAFDDCVAATRWVAAHRAELGVAARPIALAGDSAGGNLVAAVSAALRADASCPIACQALVYPVTDLANRSASYATNGKGYLLSTEAMEFFIDCYTPDPAQRLDPRASPLLARDFAGLPKTLVITAEYDPLRDEGEAYARKLEAAGVDATCVRYDGAVHGFFQMSNFIALGKDAVERCARFLADGLTRARG